MAESSGYSEEYMKEAEERIKEMEDPGYEFPQAMSKTDYFLAIALIVICGLSIIAVGFMQ